MTDQKDNFSNWCKFLFGGFLLGSGADALYQFIVSGQSTFGPSSRFPFGLGGESAAVIYVIYVVGGALLCFSGAKGLIAK
ncbi:hypothetical protein [Pseudoxanthomonas yeongjuensis]|uniref:hypothetical protein n=1 Tax=Pseudoxanthomonas yeongjuensis TaxID=377616 RepID=UPI0013910F34|nr:hypothetical protein [Pseudoxanthomonas yeongjuensis]